ncbi:hypothetical protein GCM10027440_00470 [Nocardiopsis coralliicola]
MAVPTPEPSAAASGPVPAVPASPSAALPDGQAAEQAVGRPAASPRRPAQRPAAPAPMAPRPRPTGLRARRGRHGGPDGAAAPGTRTAPITAGSGGTDRGALPQGTEEPG